MVTIGAGPGPKNVLANNGVVYPYAKFKALRGTPLSKLGPPSASAPPSAVGGFPVPADAGGTGALSPSQRLAHRKWMLEHYEEIHAYRRKYWDWKKGKRKSKPDRPELES